jgi:hypothetical protein
VTITVKMPDTGDLNEKVDSDGPSPNAVKTKPLSPPIIKGNGEVAHTLDHFNFVNSGFP